MSNTLYLREGLKRLVGKFPALSVYLRRRKEDRAQKRTPVVTKYGFKFAGNPQMESGIFEPTETVIIRSLLPHFEQFVNIGANIGYYCCHALQLGRPVVAFEPSQRNLAMLLQNVCANGWADRVEVFPVALSRAHGVLNFYGEGTGASLVPGWAGVPKTYVSRVPVSTLDRVLGDRLLNSRNLFLVDVEGAELSMLNGALKHLDRASQSAWMIEICISEHLPDGETINTQLAETFEMFWSRGFTAYAADGSARPVTQAMIERVLQSGVDDVGTHNFVFLKSPPAPELIAALVKA